MTAARDRGGRIPRWPNLQAPTSNLSDELFARAQKWKIFVSSQMRGRALHAERKAAAQAVDSTQIAEAWCWERNANAGPYSSKAVCLGHARTSDGLVLILGRHITPITRKEYKAAHDAGAPCYIFLKNGLRRDTNTSKFVTRERSHAIILNFRNLSELRTQITHALRRFAIDAGREKIMQRRTTLRASLRQRRQVTS